MHEIINIDIIRDACKKIEGSVFNGGLGGAGSFDLPQVSGFYSWTKTKIRIDFSLSSINCQCKDIVECDCDWEIEIVRFTIPLSRQEFKNILHQDTVQISLF